MTTFLYLKLQKDHDTDEKGTNQRESDLFRESSYSADVESSSESSDRGSSDSEDYIPKTCNKGIPLLFKLFLLNTRFATINHQKLFWN